MTKANSVENSFSSERPSRCVFDCPEVLSLERHAAVVNHALSWMGSASDEARRAFNAAISASPITVNGFRDALKVPNHIMLKEQVLEAVAISERMASAVLRLWAESHQALRAKAVQHLKSEGISLAAADSPDERFSGAWTFNEFSQTRDRFVEAHASDGFEAEEAGLMLCYLSGRLPGLDMSDEDVKELDTHHRFDFFLKYLDSLPPSAADWEQAIPDFVDSVRQIAASKQAHLDRIADLRSAVVELNDSQRRWLAFFERDTAGWSAGLFAPDLDIDKALDWISDLKSLFEEYQPIHSTAPTMSEEQSRSKRRDGLQKRIIESLESLDQFFSAAGELAEDPKYDLRLELVEMEESSGLDNAVAPAVASIDGSPVSTAFGESPDAPSVSSTVTGESVGRTGGDYEALQTENRDLREALDELRRDLHDSRHLAEFFRGTLRDARRDPVADVYEVPPIESLEEAVNLAKKRFVGKLKIWPNSKSEIEDNPFDSPRQAWDALEWLATTYRDSRMGETGVVDFDMSIRQACGWWYKGHQHESTMTKYEEWYSTTVDGRAHRLREHVGTGSSRDCRYTIRIGIDWDKRRNRVVVGYIGQHPKTDAT